jgi:small subunit ribosomal protein S9e
MVQPRYSKKSVSVRRPYDRQRLVNDMKLVGKYGLKSKRELRAMEDACQQIKRRARDLLIHTDADYQVVQGRALLNRLRKQGIVEEFDAVSRVSIIAALEKALDLQVGEFLDRRLQTRVFAAGLAKSIHHARVMIHQRQIAVKGFVVNKPGFIVDAENESFIEIAPNSTLATQKPGRALKKKAREAREEQ